jgi:hypothetical protein
VLKPAETQILERFSSRNEKYWGLRTQTAPQFRIAPITSNQTAISSMASGPMPEALLPTPRRAGAHPTIHRRSHPKPKNMHPMAFLRTPEMRSQLLKK